MFSTRWNWYWQDEKNKWQSFDTPGDGHAINTTSSQCLERDFVAGTTILFTCNNYCDTAARTYHSSHLFNKSPTSLFPVKHLLLAVKRQQKDCYVMLSTISFFVSEKDSHSFSASHHKYTLYFKGMYQQNDTHRTKRPVRRRPAEFVNKQNMKDIAQRYLKDFKRLMFC